MASGGAAELLPTMMALLEPSFFVMVVDDCVKKFFLLYILDV
jgi:hypothetical protein